MKDYVKGKFIKKIFSSDKGYIIGVMKVNDTNISDLYDFINTTLTFTGYFPELKEDENYMFYGELVDHPKYGLQYQVNESKLIMPDTKEGLILFLSSDLFKGIGEVMAKNIVSTLGNDCLNKILTDPSCLNLVPKLTEKKASEILETLKKYSQSHQTIVYLTDLGFSMKDAMTIYNFYKDKTIPKVEINPYKIMDDLEEITFPKIDKIHQNLNIDDLDKSRIKACIYYSMKELLFLNGDTYLYIDEIKKKTETYLGESFQEQEFLGYIDELILEDKVVLERDKVYTKTLYEAEEYISKKMYQFVQFGETKIDDIDLKIEQLQNEENITYNEKQKEAIKSALENNVVIITGGPGTGKTTIINAIVKLYSKIYNKKENDLITDLALLAPTGRASKRMMESTHLPASTIHRFLKWDKETNAFLVDEEHKDYSKLIIVDEVSMLDTELMYALLRGLTNHIKLILVGDIHQLPSVGPGNVLKDLIESDLVKTIYLDLLYRQSEESYIPVLAEEIKNNDLDEAFTNKKDDFLFLECPKEQIVPSIKRLCNQLVEKGYNDKRAIVLAPMYAGMNGIDNLNKELQDIFNPSDLEKKEITIGEVTYREQDKILQLMNMPDENVFNGDIGFIENIVPSDRSFSKKDEIYVNFDGNLVRYLPKDLVKIKHGFIVSIHKSQGSEFELVLMPICMSYYRMLYRKLIYTGVTRAKQKLIIVGERKAFEYAVANTNERIRKTSLKEKIEKMYNF